MWEIVNKDELNAVIASAKAIKAEGYTEESYDVLQEAIKAAEKVAANDDATTTEVSNAITAITDAIAGLEKTDIVDKSALEYEIGLAEIIVANIDDYRPSTVEGLADKLAAAKAVFEDATATQKAVDEAAATLREARLAARVKADLTALEEAIEKAKRYDLSKYTKESAQSLRDAISNAEKVLKDEAAIQEEADAAEKALNDSMKKLVLKNNVEGEADSTNTGATNQTAAFTGLFAVAGTSLLIIMRKRKASQKEK